MSRRQEKLQKLWEELILDNMDDLIKGASASLDSAVGSVKGAAGNLNADGAALNALFVEAMESMDREKLEHWLREAVRSLDTEKLERWARQNLASVDAEKYKRLMRDKLNRLDRDKLDEMLKEGMRLIDSKKLEERIKAVALSKFKEAARSGFKDFDRHKIEEFVNTRVDNVIRSRLDALSAADLEKLLDEKRAVAKVEIAGKGKAATKKEIAAARKEIAKADKALVKQERSNPIAKLFGLSFRLALFSAAGWIAYSHLFLEHQVPLPKAIPSELLTLPYRPSGPINVYQDRSGSGRPLLLIHSINAAASSYEMRPIFQEFRGKRPVFALDFPGFGFSARPDIEYTPEVFINAILTALTGIDAGPADVIALSLGSEFAAEAARRRPELFHSLTLISPSGLYTRDSGPFNNLAYPLLSLRLWARPFYDLLTTRQSIDYFLQKSFVGSVPSGMVDYSVATSHQPGAEHAPLYFVSGKLFTTNALERIYKLVKTPTLIIFDHDGFVRFDRLPELLASNKAVQATRIGPSLGLPHWEKGAETMQALENFWQTIKEPA
jgi:pimeloyl-ACP methyl ester carboxylesterase